MESMNSVPFIFEGPIPSRFANSDRIQVCQSEFAHWTKTYQENLRSLGLSQDKCEEAFKSLYDRKIDEYNDKMAAQFQIEKVDVTYDGALLRTVSNADLNDPLYEIRLSFNPNGLSFGNKVRLLL